MNSGDLRSKTRKRDGRMKERSRAMRTDEFRKDRETIWCL